MLTKSHWEKAQAAACAGILCGILAATLAPFNPHPHNNVAWLRDVDGIRFSGRGTLISSRPFAPPDPAGAAACSVEIWAQAASVQITGTLLGFYGPEHPASFFIRQYRQGIDSWRTVRGKFREAGATNMIVDAFHPGGPSFFALTANAHERSAYVDGALAERSARLAPFCGDLTGWLVLGNSPESDFSWRGSLRGLAIFNRELSAAEIVEHFHSWTRTGRPALSAGEVPVALYLFDERSGSVVHNRAGSAPDLTIPGHYLVLDKPFLETPWHEFKPTWDYLSDMLVNVLGFIPFGFIFCSYFSNVRRFQRAQGLAILLGFLLSLTIETLQGYLPTRGSGMTDVITNTLGAAIGTVLFRWRFTQVLYSRIGISPAE